MEHRARASNNKFETTLKGKADKGEDEYSLGGLLTNEMEMASLPVDPGDIWRCILALGFFSVDWWTFWRLGPD